MRDSLDTSSIAAYLRSLNLTGPVTTKPGRLVAGPPASVLDLALGLGLGPWIFNSPRNRAMLQKMGVGPETTFEAVRRLRSRSMWRVVWEELAAPHIAHADQAIAGGDRARAIHEVQTALILLNMACGGDQYYFHTSMPEIRKVLPVIRRLYQLLRQITGERVESVTVKHRSGVTSGLLHFPPHDAASPQIRRYRQMPALLAIHGLASNKENFDHSLTSFRQAGYATLAVDLPAHGENVDGPRLQADDEVVGVAALEVLAAHPEIDSMRIGVMGASLGGFWALRTAAASRLAKVCLAYSPAFDLGAQLNEAVPGIQEHIAHVIGAPTLREAYRLARRFHLREALQHIRCPVCLIHGTQDHLCCFAVTYEIARRVTAPICIQPMPGLDHEVANPATPEIAGPGLAWLNRNL